MRTHLRIVLIFLLLSVVSVVSVICLIRKLNDAKQLSLQRQEENSYLKNIAEELVNVQQLNWLIGDSKLLNRQLSDRNNSVYLLHELIHNGRFIFYIDSDMCGPCVDKELGNLEELASYCGKDNIMIIAKGFNQKYLFNDKRFSRWDNIYIANNTIFTTNFYNQVPIVVFAEENGEVRFAYNAPQSSNMTFAAYLDFIKSLDLWN